MAAALPSCAAEEADYFDRKGLKEYSARNYSVSLDYFDLAIGHDLSYIDDFSQAVSQDPNFLDAWIYKGNTEKTLQALNNKMHVLLALSKQKEAMQIFVKILAGSGLQIFFPLFEKVGQYALRYLGGHVG